MPLSRDLDKRKRQLANLRPWRPGEAPNPTGINGRPIQAALLREAAADDYTILSRSIWKWAKAGRPWAVQLLLDRIDGPLPKQITADIRAEMAAQVKIIKGIDPEAL
jgi:hypothetical protein